jgi:hypothetical protein
MFAGVLILVLKYFQFKYGTWKIYVEIFRNVAGYTYWIVICGEVIWIMKIVLFNKMYLPNFEIFS